ncbi:MAG: hypothetical protein AB1656_03615 [Candidatus Omnitrophota bacterium]
MLRQTIAWMMFFVMSSSLAIADVNLSYPIGQPGQWAQYQIIASATVPESVVKTFTLTFGPLDTMRETPCQWIRLEAIKENSESYIVWILAKEYPAPSLAEAQLSIIRYIFQEKNCEALEFRNRSTGEALLPALGAWPQLFPQPVKDKPQNDSFPNRMNLLGKQYTLNSYGRDDNIPQPIQAAILELYSGALIGVPSNSRTKDSDRRYDDSDYEYVRLTKDDYEEMIAAGMNCFRADKEQAQWLERRNVYYWGLGSEDLHYPEVLYRSNYLGPVLFLDEPAVCTRDHVIRPRLRADAAFRKTITPQICFEEFRKYFDQANHQGNPTSLIRGLKARPDVDVGDMDFVQQNLYTWETVVSTALYQLSENPSGPPNAIVFEPPGRIGTRRTLPEMNMAYQCQIPVDSPQNLIDIIYGFLRGAARVTNKTWGTSIYGSVDRDDAFWFLTHAYDLGAQLFFYWDSARLACVPYEECLALTRNLRNHIANHPHRDLTKLKQAAEVAILLPAGYNLGHVHIGKGNLWGIGELNLERVNSKGVKYRTVMGNFFTEIERYLRLGIAFDLCWDIPAFQSSGYREIVRIREDGKIEVESQGQSEHLDGPRIPQRPEGDPPQIEIELSAASGKAPLEIAAHARLTEISSLAYYTSGANAQGEYVNSMIFWELYGPQEEDYRILSHEYRDVVVKTNSKQSKINMNFVIDRPGKYRLRASACDLAGRTAVIWKEIDVTE